MNTTGKNAYRILITGGKGFIGTHLNKELTKHGHMVMSCDMMHSHNEVGYSVNNDISEIQYTRCDISEYRQLEQLFTHYGPFDYVFNAAAEYGRWNGEDYYETLWKTNAVGTKNIIRLQEKFGFRLIHFSSSEVYGDWQKVMSEDVMENHEVKQLNDYAISKWVNETQIRNSILQYKTESVIVRLFNVYGPGEYYSPYRSVYCRFLYCALHNIPWVVFQGHIRTSTYISDVVHALATIPKNFKSGEVYNIGGGKEHTIEELSNIIVSVTGADSSLAECRESEILTTKEKHVDASKAIRDLDYSHIITLQEGIIKTADWMRTVYRL